MVGVRDEPAPPGDFNQCNAFLNRATGNREEANAIRLNLVGETHGLLIDLEIFEHERRSESQRGSREPGGSREQVISRPQWNRPTSNVFLVYCSPVLLRHCSIRGSESG
jgi:hypothetical protein